MLTYKGLPVPYVAAWSSERRFGQDGNGMGLAEDQMQVMPREGNLPVLRYVNEVPADRDRLGVLWMRENNTPGKGAAEFATIHAARQRRCMTVGACQVCGFAFKTKRWTFLVVDENWVEGAITTTAPVCERCVPIAARACPHLRSRNLMLISARAIPSGVLGDHIDPYTGVVSRMVMVSYADPRILTTYAKQQAVTLTDVTVIPYRSSDA